MPGLRQVWAARDLITREILVRVVASDLDDAERIAVARLSPTMRPLPRLVLHPDPSAVVPQAFTPRVETEAAPG